MVLTAGSGREHISEQHTRYVVLAGERVVVVKMAVPADGLTIVRRIIIHRHVTSHDFIVLLGNSYDNVLRVVVTPSGDKYSVLVVVLEVVIRSIVDGELGLE